MFPLSSCWKAAGGGGRAVCVCVWGGGGGERVLAKRAGFDNFAYI